MEKFIKAHYGKIAIALILLGLYYYKVYKPKADAKKAVANPTGTKTNDGKNHDSDIGFEGVNLGNESNSNTNVGVNLPIGVKSDLTGGGDIQAPVMNYSAPILSGGDNTRNFACPGGYKWNQATGWCELVQSSGFAQDVFL